MNMALVCPPHSIVRAPFALVLKLPRLARVRDNSKGALPGGSAEASGKFQAGDLISAVDGVSFAGRSLSEAKKMFVGHEGTMLLLSAVRPTTGKEFSVSLRRMALAKAESPIRKGEGVGNSGGKTYTTSF